MNTKDLPRTAEFLNVWLYQHFQVFTGPARAYFDLSFPVTIGFSGETQQALTHHRVNYLSLAFSGRQEETCKAMASWLRTLISPEEFIDAITPLFIRKDFSWERETKEEPACLYGRIAFWDSEKNKKLMTLPCYKAQGARPLPVELPE